MVRDTYSDFRKRLLTDSATAEQSEQLAESKAEEKMQQLRNEIKSELTKVVDKIGQTDAKVISVREQLERVVDKAIVRSREVDREAREETVKDSILNLLGLYPHKTWQIVEVLKELSGRFSATDIGKALFELAQDDIIEFDVKTSRWQDLSIQTTFRLLV